MYNQSSNYSESYEDRGGTSCESCVDQLLYEFDTSMKTYKFYGATKVFFGLDIDKPVNRKLKSWLELIHHEDRFLVRNTMLSSCVNHENYNISYRIQIANGFFRQVQDSGYISRLGNSLDTVIIGTIRRIKKHCFFIENEEYFNTELINSSIHEGVIQIGDTGKIIYWNNAAQRIFGYYKEEILGENFHNILTPNYKEGFENSIKSLLKTGDTDIIGKYLELEALRKDGELIPIELRISSVFLNGKWNAVVVVRDISERKLKDIIVSETLSFEKLVTSISSRFIGNFNFDHVMYSTLRDIGIERNIDRVYLFLFNSDQLRFDYAYEWCDKGIESHINYYNKKPINKYPWAMQRLRNRQYLEINNIDDMPVDANNLKQDLIKNKIKCTLACPILKNDDLIGFIGFDIETKKRKWNFNDRTLLQFCSQTIANALERKSTEDKLTESESKYKNLFKTAPLMIILLNFKGFIVDVNKKVCDTFDLKKKDIIRKNIIDLNLIRKEKLPLFKGKLKDLLKNSSITPFDIPVLSDNFKLNWVRLYASLISINKQPLIQVILQDISQKKRFELELIDSERKYRNIFDGATDAIFLLDKDKIIDANKMAVKMYGFKSKSDFIGISPWNLSPYYQKNGYRSKDLALDYIERGLNGELLNFTWKHIRNDGTLFDAEISLNRQKHGKTYFLQAIIRDVSEKIKAEKNLTESKKQFQSIIESIGDALHVIDRNFIVVYKNSTLSKWLQFFNIDSNITGKDIRKEFNFLPRKIEEEYAHVFNTGEILVTIEKTNLNNIITYTETRKVPLISDGNVRYILTIIRDITKEKNSETILRESEKKFRTLFESSKDGIILLDAEGSIIESNQAFLDLIGYSIEEIKTAKSLNLINFKGLFTKNETLKAELEINGFIEEFESELKEKNGKIVPVSIVLWTLKEDDERINRIWAIIRDISERKKADHLQEKFKESLENEVILRTNELNKVLNNQRKLLDHIAKTSQFKTEFLASMSHELRTPLNAIIGFTDLLLEESYGKMNKVQLEFISDIQDSSHHLLDMITRILDISKIESGELSIKLENFNLHDLIEHVISTFKPLTQKKNLELECKFVKKNQIIQADRVKLKQILYNLIGNAVKFTIEGKISLEFSEDNDYWIFKVKDTGIGIAKKDFDKIFKDFQRVKSAYVESIAGSGLGLALTKRIVNLHGGIITFQTKLGVGTTFSFTIPKQYKNKKKTHPVHEFLNAL